MPFKSKRQMRAAFGGHIPGISKEKAKEWADKTSDPKGLPERAPKEKGKPTLRTKKTALSTIEYALLAGGLLAAGGAAYHHLKNRSKAQPVVGAKAPPAWRVNYRSGDSPDDYRQAHSAGLATLQKFKDHLTPVGQQALAHHEEDVRSRFAGTPDEPSYGTWDRMHQDYVHPDQQKQLIEEYETRMGWKRPKTAMLRAKTVNKLLYLADKFDDVDPNVAKNLFDVHQQETDALDRRKHSQALELLGAKLALAIPGPGQVRSASRAVGKFTGMAPKSSPALRAPGPRTPGVVRPTAGLDTAMERFRV